MSGCGGECESRPHYTHTLMVQKPGTEVYDNGQRVDDDTNWVDLGRIRARFITRGGNSTTLGNRESQIYRQLEATVTSVLRANWTPKWEALMGLLPSCRLQMKERIFHIHAAYRINEIGREMQFELEERRQDS